MTSPEILLLFECYYLRPKMALSCFIFIVLLFLVCSASVERVWFPFSSMQPFMLFIYLYLYVIMPFFYFIHWVHIWDKTLLWILHSVFNKRNLCHVSDEKICIKSNNNNRNLCVWSTLSMQTFVLDWIPKFVVTTKFKNL